MEGAGATPPRARPAGGGHDDGGQEARERSRPELGEPALGGRIRHRDGVVHAQHEQPGHVGAVGRRIGGDRRAQHGTAQPLRQAAGQRRHERGVGRRERRPVGPAQQRQRAPGARVAHEHRPQLVAEPVGRPQFAVADAAVELAAGHLAEARGQSPCADEAVERVDVQPAHLDLGHPLRGVLRQPALDHLPGRQARRRIQGEDADAVERHRAREHLRGGEREGAHAVTAVGEAVEVVADALRRSRHAASVPAGAGRPRRPTPPVRISGRPTRATG